MSGHEYDAGAREALAGVLAWHLPESYGDHGCAVRCGWSDEDTTESAPEHLADALLASPEFAALIAGERAGALREAAEAWEGGPTGAAPVPRWWLRDRAAREAGP